MVADIQQYSFSGCLHLSWLGSAEMPCKPERAARVTRTAVKALNLENMTIGAEKIVRRLKEVSESLWAWEDLMLLHVQFYTSVPMG